MRLGLMLPALGPLATGPGAAANQLAVARHAEALGFESLWVPDHVIVPHVIRSKYPYSRDGAFAVPPEQGLLEPLVTLGFLAGVTERIRLGTWVMVLPHRNPIVTAKMWATLDVLSGGRMQMGAGVGWMEEEIRLLGAPFEKRGALSDEYLRAMRALWTEAEPRFAGEFVRFSGIACEPKPIQRPLPIWIGGESERALRRVVEHGTGWLAVANSFEAFRANRARLEAAAERAGRPFAGIDVQITTSYTPTLDAFFEEAQRYAALGHDSFMAPTAFWGQSLDELLRSLDSLAARAARF